MFPLHLDNESASPEEKYLCLDFMNTLDWRASDHPVEKLNAYTDLLEWAHEEGLVDAVEVGALCEKAELYPEDAAVVLERAVELREAAYSVVMAGIQNQPAPRAGLNRLNEYINSALSGLQLVQGQHSFQPGWSDDRLKLDWFLRPIARSVLEMLTTADLQRVKQCASEQGCGWMFYDTSRNKSRRWCSMDSCGNRAKASSFYRRHSASS